MLLLIDQKIRETMIKNKDSPEAIRYILSQIYGVPLKQIPKIMSINITKNGDIEIIFSRSANLPLYKKIKSEQNRV